MTGGNRPKVRAMPEPSPQPTPEIVNEMTGAKEKVKRKGRATGRQSQILAGALNRRVLDFGKSKVGE